MTAFNRVFLAVYSLLWIGACAGVATLVWNQDQKLDLSLGSVNLQALIVSDDADRWVFTALLALLSLLGLLTLGTAFRRASVSTAGFVHVNTADGGVVEVSTAAVETLLKTELERLPQVRQAVPVVHVEGDAIRPDVTLSVEPGYSIAELTRLVRDRISSVLRDEVGISRQHRPTLHLTNDQIAVSPAGRMRPQAPASPPEGDLPPPPPPPGSPPLQSPALPPPPRMASSPLPAPPRPAHERPASFAAPSPPASSIPPAPPRVEDAPRATPPDQEESRHDD